MKGEESGRYEAEDSIPFGSGGQGCFKSSSLSALRVRVLDEVREASDV